MVRSLDIARPRPLRATAHLARATLRPTRHFRVLRIADLEPERAGLELQLGKLKQPYKHESVGLPNRGYSGSCSLIRSRESKGHHGPSRGGRGNPLIVTVWESAFEIRLNFHGSAFNEP